MKRLLSSLIALGLCAGLVSAASSQLRELPSPRPNMRTADRDPAPETIDLATDRTDRMTISVDIDGQGPYPFIVDTGAERTVIARQLADTLNLADRGDVTLATVSAMRRVPSVHIGELRVGRRTVNDIHAPALEEEDLGAMGMLGVDTLQSQRVVFDFGRQQLSLSTSHLEEQNWPRDTIVIRGRTRLGRMVLTDATIDGQSVRVIIDTGSQVTVGNNALRRRLESRGRLGQLGIMHLHDVSGGRTTAEYAVTRRMRLGGVHLNDMPIAFADFHLFSYLGLDDRPAILLGMDALRMFERVSIDFANRRVRLLPGDTSQQGIRIRLAGGATVAAR